VTAARVVTASVRTNESGNEAIVYELVIVNSGSVVAKAIEITIVGSAALAAALASG
jgi:hypothetical protein